VVLTAAAVMFLIVTVMMLVLLSVLAAGAGTIILTRTITTATMTATERGTRVDIALMFVFISGLMTLIVVFVPSSLSRLGR